MVFDNLLLLIFDSFILVFWSYRVNAPIFLSFLEVEKVISFAMNWKLSHFFSMVMILIFKVLLEVFLFVPHNHLSDFSFIDQNFFDIDHILFLVYQGNLSIICLVLFPMSLFLIHIHLLIFFSHCQSFFVRLHCFFLGFIVTALIIVIE
jgi:hypothetical protein